MITLAEWLKALRSGQYKQGRGFLFHPRDNTYCCLGVGAKLAGQDVVEQKNPGDVPILISLPTANFISDLPKEMAWDPEERFDIWLKPGDDCASALNDRGMSFSQIADAVEETARGYGWEG